MVIFSISGSLREGSSNAEVLRLLKPHLPKSTEILTYQGLSTLPHFNPDLDHEHDQENVPEPVKELRGMVSRSSVIIISTPEYAHGIPGSLKNALDWLVSTTALEKKPTGIIFASTSEGNFAQKALVEVLKTMSANVVPGAVISIPGIHQKIHDMTINEDLKKFLDNLLSQAVLKS